MPSPGYCLSEHRFSGAFHCRSYCSLFLPPYLCFPLRCFYCSVPVEVPLRATGSDAPLCFLPLFFLQSCSHSIMKASLTARSDGASLVYTSVKEMKNLDILYKYLVHRLYGFPFHCSAQVVERDAVFM